MSSSLEDRLQEIRRLNAQRWNTIKELHEQWNHLNSIAEQQGESSPKVVDTREAALRAELHVLRQSATSTSLDTIDKLKGSDYAYEQELIESFDELQEANAVLEMQLDRKSKRIQNVRELLAQHNQVHKALEAMTTTTSPNQVESSNRPERLQNENKWIRSELAYVASCWEEQKQKEKQQQAEESCSDKLRRDRRIDRGREGLWSLDQLVFELTQNFTTAPADPYISVHDTPAIDPRHVDLLLQCHVIEQSKDDANMVCLTDYAR